MGKGINLTQKKNLQSLGGRVINIFKSEKKPPKGQKNK